LIKAIQYKNGEYKYSFFPRTILEWNKLSQDVRSKPSVASFRSALLKVPGPVENNLSHGTPGVTDIRPLPDICQRTEEVMVPPEEGGMGVHNFYK